jgi:protein subunit release factor B
MPVSKRKQHDLSARMRKLRVREEDLDERFTRSRGPGGQHVNKTSTCVVLRHLPTGTEVRCQTERSQAANRYLARRRLLDKLEHAALGRRSAVERRRWKIRKQKARRSRRAKEKVLEQKRKRSEKKRLRKRVEII